MGYDIYSNLRLE